MKLHEPVMVHQVVENLVGKKHIKKPTNLKKETFIIDCTLGTAGHTLALLEAGAKILGIEADIETLEVAQSRLAQAGHDGDFVLVHANFVNLENVAKASGFGQVDGVLFDLGVNIIQLTSTTRGFSFANPKAPLDMRISKEGPTAADLLNVLRSDQLVVLFAKVLNKDDAHKLASRVVMARKEKQFARISDFVRLTAGIGEKTGLAKGTLALMAVRMAVNSELENLETALPQAFDLLKPGGKLAVISFHSGEAKLVGDFCSQQVQLGRAEKLDEVRPEKIERLRNPSARSAILTILKKNATQNSTKNEER